MRIEAMLCFWLGSLDSRVAAGRQDVGGTHDIRFCSRGEEVREFTGTEPDEDGRWLLRLEPYPEASIDTDELAIAEYGGARQGECALPAQFAGSGNEYPLWRRVVRPYSREATRRREAILLLRDEYRRFHARIVRREHVAEFPDELRTQLEEYDDCGRLILLDPKLELLDLPFQKARNHIPPFVLEPVNSDEEEEVEDVLGTHGAQGTEPAGERHRRSRILAEKLKKLYQFRCQLCSDEVPRIDMGGGRYYVEVHHIEGYSEIDKAQKSAGTTQESSELLIDRAENIVVVCPYHHALLHHDVRDFTFAADELAFVGKNHATLPLMTNKHLGR